MKHENNDMTSEITVDNAVTHKDFMFISTVLFYKFSLGSPSLYLTISVLIIWALSEPGYSSVFIKIIVFTSLPWLLFAFRKAVNFFKEDKIIYTNMTFKNDCFLMNTERNEVRLDFEIPRNAIKNVLYLKNYIIILSNRNMKFIIMRKSLTEDKKSLLTDYLNISLKSSRTPPPIHQKGYSIN